MEKNIRSSADRSEELKIRRSEECDKHAGRYSVHNVARGTRRALLFIEKIKYYQNLQPSAVS